MESAIFTETFKKMMKHFSLITITKAFTLITLFFLLSCQGKKQEMQSPPKIPVFEAMEKDVPVYETFLGHLYGQKDIPVRARVSGFLEGMFFKEGSKVKKGQLLYTIDSRPYQAKVAMAESQLAQAITSLVKAENDLRRIEPLAAINAVSQSDLDAAKAQYDAAKAYVEASKSNLELAKIELGYCRVTAQTSGIIGKTKATVGEFVGQNPNPVILNTISLIDSVFVDFYLTERDFLIYARTFLVGHKKIELRENKKRKLPVSLILADGSTFKHKGFVNFIDRNVNPSTGTLLVQTVFPNPEGLLRPGLYTKVKVQMNLLKKAVVIPQRCIMELQGLYSVFVVSDSNTVKKVEVEPGYKTGNMQVINKGLKAGDQVVIDALQKVHTGLKITPTSSDFKPVYETSEN